jgi:asparagine synthetase B (glutamine-hydrolysing)
MEKDLDRLWLRNCGRDERVCGENLIELRFPYLDNELMKFLGCIEDMKQIVDFDKPRGEGEKYLLRKVAKDLVGFKLCYKFEKRAIQFGTKIAHQTNIHKYGSNNKANGKAQFDEIK